MDGLESDAGFEPNHSPEGVVEEGSLEPVGIVGASIKGSGDAGSGVGVD